jgi:alpha-1,2-mannosyltransferase
VKLVSHVRSLAARALTAHAAHPRRLRLAFAAALAVVVLLASAKYAAKISKPGDGGELTRSAFLRWREMINGVFAGENIYVGANEYPNPPIMAIVLKPFAALPPKVGALAWFYAKVLMAALAAVWAWRLVRGQSASAPESQSARKEDALTLSPPHPLTPARTDLAFGLAVLLCLQPLLGDLSHNNVNIFILFLVAGALEAFRRRYDVLAGALTALAVACKVTPLVFVAYFVWKGCWRAVTGCALGLALWLVLVPGIAFGFDRNAELMQGWYALMIERPLLKGEVCSEHPNQALVGFVYRLFTHSPSYIVYPNNIPTPAEYHNLCDIGTRAAWAVVKALTLLFALAVVVLFRARARGPEGERGGLFVAAECAFLCVGMLLLSERTWKHHAVVLLLPYAVLCCAALASDLPARVRKGIGGALALAAGITVGAGALSGRAADLALVYGAYTAQFVALAAAVGLLLACRFARACGPRGAPAQTFPN